MKKLIVTLFILSISLFGNNTMSPSFYKAITNANKLMDENKISSAKEELNKLLETKNTYEKSYVLQSLSNIYLEQNNYEKAKDCYKEIIKLGAFEDGVLEKFKLSLAKIYLSTNEYDKSFKLSLPLLKSQTIQKQEVLETIVYAKYYLNDFKNTISYSKELMNIQNIVIKESWYKILYSSYIELNDKNNAIKIMDIMTRKWSNNEDYWMQLASLYEQTNKIQKAISTLELAQKNKILTKENNILYFASLLLGEELYIKASKVLKTNLQNNKIKTNEKNFEIYISTLINAKEYKNAIKEIENADFKSSDNINILLANLYYLQEEYNKSVEVLNKNIHYSKKKEGERHLLLGVNYYELNKRDDSFKHLKQALKFKYTKARAKSLLKELKVNS